MLERLTELLFGQTEYDPSRRSFLKTSAVAAVSTGTFLELLAEAEAKPRPKSKHPKTTTFLSRKT